MNAKPTYSIPLGVDPVRALALADPSSGGRIVRANACFAHYRYPDGSIRSVTNAALVPRTRRA